MELKMNDILSIKAFWIKKRLKYNIGITVAAFMAFMAYIAYIILGSYLIMPYDNEFEITLFTFFFQGILFIIVLAIANLFYNLGYFVDLHFNKKNSEIFRLRLFNLGFWFSVVLPFHIPLLVVINYLLRFK